jgi:hypothetical protein
MHSIDLRYFQREFCDFQRAYFGMLSIKLLQILFIYV